MLIFLHNFFDQSSRAICITFWCITKHAMILSNLLPYFWCTITTEISRDLGSTRVKVIIHSHIYLYFRKSTSQSLWSSGSNQAKQRTIICLRYTHQPSLCQHTLRTTLNTNILTYLFDSRIRFAVDRFSFVKITPTHDICMSRSQTRKSLDRFTCT